MGAHPAASERDARSLQDAVPFEAAVACAISSGIERSRRAARLGRRRSFKPRTELCPRGGQLTGAGFSTSMGAQRAFYTPTPAPVSHRDACPHSHTHTIHYSCWLGPLRLRLLLLLLPRGGSFGPVVASLCCLVYIHSHAGLRVRSPARPLATLRPADIRDRPGR